jgi:hypothetical protein
MWYSRHIQLPETKTERHNNNRSVPQFSVSVISINMFFFLINAFSLSLSLSLSLCLHHCVSGSSGNTLIVTPAVPVCPGGEHFDCDTCCACMSRGGTLWLWHLLCLYVQRGNTLNVTAAVPCHPLENQHVTEKDASSSSSSSSSHEKERRHMTSHLFLNTWLERSNRPTGAEHQ